DHVAAVAWVPSKDVVAGAAEHDVTAPAPFDEVVTITADQSVGTIAAGDAVIARAAVNGQIDDTGRQAGGIDRVVTAERVYNKIVIGPLGPLNIDCGMQTGHREIGSTSADLNRVRAAGAVNGDGVGRAIAGAAACGRRQVEVDLGHVRAGQVVDSDVVGS